LQERVIKEGGENKIMKRFFRAFCAVTVFCSALLMTTNAMAILYLPDLNISDSVGVAAYTPDGDSGSLSLTTSFFGQLVFDQLHVCPCWQSVNLNAKLDKVDGDRWYFGSNGGSTPDIVVNGSPLFQCSQPGFTSTGNLITATLDSLVFNSTQDQITGNFTITGGDLYPFYANAGYKGLFEIFPEFYTYAVPPVDASTSWASCGLKGDISPVPEPCSMLLFGMGIFAPFLAKKKLFSK
jgi:hypothetical protein